MATLFVHHKVKDYAAWRKAFDEGAALRTSYGCTGQRVFQSPSDPNEITVLLEWQSVDQAEAYAAADELKEAMKNAGVTSEPDVMFLAEA
ncbi:MAG: antibiotic biosynthesis monooxygenase [Anaerolineales bacterium]